MKTDRKKISMESADILLYFRRKNQKAAWY